jgi:hypothetical protein
VSKTVTIDAYAVSDHVSRLYGLPVGDGWYEHIDNEACRLRYVTWGDSVNHVVELSDGAVKEFVDDMEYQVEATDSSTVAGREYRSLCRRALRQVLSA